MLARNLCFRDVMMSSHTVPPTWVLGWQLEKSVVLPYGKKKIASLKKGHVLWPSFWLVSLIWVVGGWIRPAIMTRIFGLKNSHKIEFQRKPTSPHEFI